MLHTSSWSRRKAVRVYYDLMKSVVDDDVETTFTTDTDLVERLLEFSEKANRNPLVS